MSSAGVVEERSLAAVGITYQGHGECLAFAVGQSFQLFFGELNVLGNGLAPPHLIANVAGLGLCFSLAHHLYHSCLIMPQAYFVAHQLVLHGVLQGRVEQCLHRLSLDEAHFDDAFAETSVAAHLYDISAFACFQF